MSDFPVDHPTTEQLMRCRECDGCGSTRHRDSWRKTQACHVCRGSGMIEATVCANCSQGVLNCVCDHEDLVVLMGRRSGELV